MKNITFIDLFAGMGGTRIGFEDAFKKHYSATQGKPTMWIDFKNK